MASLHGVNAQQTTRTSVMEPVYYLDSVEIAPAELQKVAPGEIATVTVFKDEKAIEKFGEKGRNGVVFIESKEFIRKKKQPAGKVIGSR